MLADPVERVSPAAAVLARHELPVPSPTQHPDCSLGPESTLNCLRIAALWQVNHAKLLLHLQRPWKGKGYVGRKQQGAQAKATEGMSKRRQRDNQSQNEEQAQCSALRLGQGGNWEEEDKPGRDSRGIGLHGRWSDVT